MAADIPHSRSAAGSTAGLTAFTPVSPFRTPPREGRGARVCRGCGRNKADCKFYDGDVFACYHCYGGTQAFHEYLAKEGRWTMALYTRGGHLWAMVCEIAREVRSNRMPEETAKAKLRELFTGRIGNDTTEEELSQFGEHAQTYKLLSERVSEKPDGDEGRETDRDPVFKDIELAWGLSQFTTPL